MLDDLMFDRRRYTPETAYAQSKLANLSCALELQRRLAMVRSDAISMAAHPGTPPPTSNATAPGVTGGSYHGPAGIGELRGRGVTRARINPAARDTATAVGLWEASQELTGERHESLVE